MKRILLVPIVASVSGASSLLAMLGVLHAVSNGSGTTPTQAASAIQEKCPGKITVTFETSWAGDMTRVSCEYESPKQSAAE